MLGHKKHALACFEASIKYYGNESMHKRKAIALQNGGAILNTMGRYEEAEMYHEAACQTHGKMQFQIIIYLQEHDTPVIRAENKYQTILKVSCPCILYLS